MNNHDNSIAIASKITDEIKKLQPLDRNFVAMLTAQMLSERKDKCELNEIIHFLQLIILALKTYTNC
ncbi:MAG: hypothetical protein HDT36_03095 [Clostridiales bacterium]|nr:hypothetical protein [Clostridiales bacterium]